MLETVTLLIFIENLYNHIVLTGIYNNDRDELCKMAEKVKQK